MADVFVSYAREDIEFVRGLHDALRNGEREIWVDWQGIPPSAEWLREIHAAIEAAPSFIFVISPDSLASRVCGLELDHAALHKKRIIAVVHRDPVTPAGEHLSVPEAVGKINWIFSRQDDAFGSAIAKVVESLETDLEHVRAHARLTVRAVEWEASGTDDGFLLRGRDLEDARLWLNEGGSKNPEPSALHRSYIEASRRAAADIVASRALVGFPDDPELGVLLAEAALTEFAETPAAVFALRMTLAASPLRALLRDHDGDVLARWSRDGGRLVTIGKDGTARIWDARAGTELSALMGHVAPVTTVAWSPDGAWIATGSGDGTARVWSSATGTERTVLSHDTFAEGIVSVAWSEDGSRVLTAPKNGRTAIWNIEESTADPLWLNHSRWLVAAHWNLPTNRVLLLTASRSGGAIAYDAATGATLFGLRLTSEGVRDGSWSHDGSLIATYSGSRANIWSGEDGAAVAELAGHTSDITSVAFDATGSWVATASTDRTVRIWDPRTGIEKKRLSRHENSVLSVSWSPDGKRLLTVAADRTARIWDAARERQIVELREEGPSSQHGGAWSPHGTHVVIFGSANGSRVYAAYPGDWSFGFAGPEGEKGARSDDEMLLLQWITNGTQILAVWPGGSVELRDGETGIFQSVSLAAERVTGVWLSPDQRRLLTMDQGGIPHIHTLQSSAEAIRLNPPDDAVQAMHWAPDGSRVLMISTNGRTLVSDASSGEFIAEAKARLRPLPGQTTTASWSPDGIWFLTCPELSPTESVCVWDAATGERLSYVPGADLGSVWSAAWSPDGRRIVIVAKSVGVIEPVSGKIVRVLSPGEDLFFPPLSFSPDSARALIGLPSGVVEIWDLEGGGTPLLLRGHEDRVHFGVWSADGAQVLTMSDDATARVWNAMNGNLRTTLRGHDGPVWGARWSGDERLILTRSQDHSARVWDARSANPIVRIGGIDDPVGRAEWHPGRHRLLTETASGAWIWDIDLGVEPLLAKARDRVSRRLTPHERRSYGLPAAR